MISVTSFSQKVSPLELSKTRKVRSIIYPGFDTQKLKDQRRVLSKGMTMELRFASEEEMKTKKPTILVVEPVTQKVMGQLPWCLSNVLAHSVWDCVIDHAPKGLPEPGTLTREYATAILTVKTT